MSLRGSKMKKKQKLQRLRNLFSAVLVLILLFMLPGAVLAEEAKYYKTWEEYSAANGLEERNWHEVADAIDVLIGRVEELYEAGEKKDAYEYAKATYWGYYETTGFERNVMTYISGSRVSAVELQFVAFRKAVKKDGGSLEAVKAEGQKLSDMLHEDADVLQPDGRPGDQKAAENVENTEAQPSDNQSPTPKNPAGGAVAAFIGSLAIILREGLEAILIVGAIIAYLIKTGNKRSVTPVYFGAAFAVVCSFIMAYFIDYLKKINPENAMSQEIIEGAAALLAVAVLFYVSNWMVSKSESALWSQYIESKVAGSLERGSAIALGFTAWLAVFREGAEVILFYQPLMQESNANMVWLGFLSGCAILVVVFLLIRFLSIRLPLKPFFLATSILMAVMAICFLGAGIKEFIEGGLIEAAYQNWFQVTEVLDILGIYPLYETLIPQFVLLVITVVTFGLQVRKNKKMRLELEAKAGGAAAAGKVK